MHRKFHKTPRTVHHPRALTTPNALRMSFHERIAAESRRRHDLSSRHLDEQAFRFNERTNNDAGRFELAITGIIGKRLTYETLIGGSAEI